MYKLKDIFDFDENENKGQNKEVKKEKSQLDRMKELNETYTKRGEFIKDDSTKIIDEEKINKESERLKKLSKHRLNEDDTSLYGAKFAGQGQTVNTFMPTIADAAKNNAYASIKPDEALDISIKRAIESGTPINNMGFYDEVNWHLNNLGFDSKLPLDIKNSLVKIVGGNLDTTVD